jgi:hypothetical protein
MLGPTLIKAFPPVLNKKVIKKDLVEKISNNEMETTYLTVVTTSLSNASIVI